MEIRLQSTEIATSSREEEVQKALDIAVQFGGIDGDHHKAWVIDQMVRALTGCPLIERQLTGYNGAPYTFFEQGKSEAYSKLVAQACDGEDGPQTYEWDEGCPP